MGWIANLIHFRPKSETPVFFPQISHLGPIFIKFGWTETKTFYWQTCSLGESYMAHLYSKHFNLGTGINTIKRDKSTFGRLARFVLFGDAKLCS